MQFYISHFVPFARPLKVGAFTKGAERRTPRVWVCLQIEAMVGVTYAVTHVKGKVDKIQIHIARSLDIFLSQALHSCL